MFSFDTQNYGRACAELLDGAELCPLGPGQPNEAVREPLEQLTDERLLDGQPVQDREMAACCRSGLWLLHNYLDQSHRISQDISTAAGSYWHGIMHRREPDFSNAKYWFGQVGNFPVYAILADDAAALVEQHQAAGADFLRNGQWDPRAFVDYCESAQRESSANAQLAREIADLEWKILFDYCYRKAAGL